MHFLSRYRTFFSIQEIERSSLLQWFFGAMLLFFFLTFSRFIGADLSPGAAGSGNAVCWPYFQSCSHLYTLSALPYGYSQSEFYMVLYAIMLYICYLMWKRSWLQAHMLMSVLWVWKMFVIFILSYVIAGPYDYYHVILTAILLFVPFKEYFLKLTFVFLYFMSVTPKFDETWTLGTYFTAMNTGLPLFPTSLSPLFTNIVIFFQVIGCWFLLSAHRLYQRIAFSFAFIFHLYSGILVAYLYPTIALPPLLILFGPLYRHSPIPFSKKAWWGWSLIAVIVVFQILGFVASPDRRFTLEGNRFGMFMFEANHQCIATVDTYVTGERVASSTTSTLSCKGFFCLTETRTFMNHNEAVYEARYESAQAWSRCDPYQWWAKLHAQCIGAVSHIRLTFDHSVNGGPFYRVVDEANICDTTYKPLVHNDWIIMPPAARIVGYPVENYY